MAEEFPGISRNEKQSVCEHLSKAYGDKIENNRKALLSIIDVLISLTKRGSCSKDQNEEDTKFMLFVKWKAENNVALTLHLNNAPCNVMYLSSTIQNELIDCFASILRVDIVAEAMKSEYLSIMADETCDICRTEQ